VIYVVVDERLLCLRDSILNGEKLLGYLQAWLLRLHHLHDVSKMPFGSLQALEDGRMGLVERRLSLQHCHILPGGYVVASTRLPKKGSRGVSMRRFVIVMAILGFAHSAHAHGIAGNRFFPGTLSFDDPAVADESILPLFSSSKHPDEGGDVVDNRFTWSFFRLLTPTLGVGVDSGWVHRDWGSSRSSGFDTTNLTIKGEVYRNDLHETLVSAGLAWGIGHSGAQGAGANAPDLIAPGIFFGKGFGDLPDSLAWLRPFGITGALTLEHPMTGMSTTSGIDPLTGQLGSILMPDVDTLHWGFAIEFSTLYLTNRFTPGKLPKEEPLNQLVPLVEFSFVSARGQKTVATMNPGLSYVAVSWQVAAEAIVPLNSEAGRSIGARAQLLLFLDELIPSLFGKPLLSR